MACYAAGVLLAAFAALVALPLQAQAQTTVWSATLTVRNLGSSTHGCSNSVATSFCSNQLNDDDFTHDSTDYAVYFIFLRSNGNLEIDFDTDLTTATQGLTLNVDGTAFAFEDADSKSAQFRRWNSTALSWSALDSVPLTLTESADAPDPPTDLTANAKGETQVDLSWTAPADNGGEAISGYKVEVSANGTSTWSDLAADTASTDTTYSHTGLAAGNTRHYRVSAINSVDSGDASGVAGATTAAANVLVSNTGRSVDPEIDAGVATGDEDKTHSQGFDTGPNPGGYSLASVGVYVTRPSLEAGEAFTVHIYTAASNGTLDTLQHTLTSPASYTDNAVNTFTAPAGATLDASTDYFVVFEGTANAGLDFVLGVTATNSQDRGTRAGWGIENARRFNSVTSSSGASFQISVNGTAIPTPMPSNSGLVPTGLVPRRHLPAAVPLLHQAHRQRQRHRHLQHPRPDRRRGRPHRHPGIQRGFPGGRLHQQSRCQRQYPHALHDVRPGRAHPLAQRRQGRRRLRGFLRRGLGRGGRPQGRVRHRRRHHRQLPLDRLRPRRHRVVR